MFEKLKKALKSFITTPCGCVPKSKPKQRRKKMNKKVIAIFIALSFMVGICYADTLSLTDTVKAIGEKLPPMKQGVMYDFAGKQVRALSTFEVANWKNISLEAGYATSDAMVATISYPIVKLKDLGVTIPILDLVECNVGGTVGIARIGGTGGDSQNQLVAGVSVTLINLKF